jgi:cob(I)alamin adenosyltransferase
MAIHITRVYTRGGDGGQTSLVGGARVDKECQKLESYGTVDELICLVGMARTVIAADSLQEVPIGMAPIPGSGGEGRRKAGGLSLAVRSELESGLRKVQNRLFDMGSILATPAGESYAGMPEIRDEDSAELEREMDRMQESLDPLNSFVLPGGTLPNAALHQCRAVCRRAEREILRLAREEQVDKRLLKYINRLSDYFFVMSRYASRKAGAREYLWEYGISNPGNGSKSVSGRKAHAKDAHAKNGHAKIGYSKSGSRGKVSGTKPRK